MNPFRVSVLHKLILPAQRINAAGCHQKMA